MLHQPSFTAQKGLDRLNNGLKLLVSCMYLLQNDPSPPLQIASVTSRWRSCILCSRPLVIVHKSLVRTPHSIRDRQMEKR